MSGAALVIVENDLRVGRLAIVIVTDASAEADDARRQLGLTEDPTGDVHLVDALVAEVAVAGIPRANATRNGPGHSFCCCDAGVRSTRGRTKDR